MRRFLFLLFFLLALYWSGAAFAILVPDHISYNCISNDGVRVQLNRHLEFGMPYLRGELTSPDGSVVIQLWKAGRTHIIQLEDRVSGHVKILQRIKTETLWWEWKWSSDSRFVYYNWENRSDGFRDGIATRDGSRSAVLSSTTNRVSLSIVQFSPDNEHLWLYDYGSNTLSVTSTRTFQRNIVRSVGSGGGPNVYVATSTPAGNRLAFNLGSSLMIADPVSHQIHWVAYIHLYDISQWLEFEPSLSIEWSPDGKYVAVMYRPTGEDLHLDIFAVKDVTPLLANKIVVPMEYEYGGVSYQFSRQFAQWSDAGHKFLFFRPSGVNDVVSDEIDLSQRYELWQYDPESGESQRMTGDVLQFSASKAAMITARQDGEYLVEELHSINGTGSFILGRYPASEIEQRECDFGNRLLMCHYPASPWQVWFLDKEGELLWSWTAPAEPEENSGKPYGTYSDPDRFASVTWQHAEETWVDLFDLETRKTYHVPITVDGVEPLSWSYWDNEVPDFYWTLDFFPSPEDNTWLVLASGYEGTEAFFRFLPEQNDWKLLYHDQRFRYPISNVVWSPDNRLFAFTNRVSGDPLPSLFVMKVDGSRQWNLGYFPRYEFLSWDKCGGVRTLLLGDE